MSVGSTVRTAREAAKMTVGDLSVKTRLRPALLSGIERDDFSACGGYVYARGHLRTIATMIGVDATALIAEFDSTHAPIVDSLEESSKNFSEVNSHRGALPFRKLSVVAGVLVVAALAWGVGHGIGVQLAVGQQLSFDLFFALNMGVWVNGLKEGLHRHATILHAVEAIHRT